MKIFFNSIYFNAIYIDKIYILKYYGGEIVGMFKDIIRRLADVEKMRKRKRLPFFARNTMKMEKPKIRNISLLRFTKYEIDESEINIKKSKWINRNIK